MSRRITFIERVTSKIIEEFVKIYNIKLGVAEQERFRLYILTRLTMVYNEGFGDGLEKARDIFHQLPVWSKENKDAKI